MGGGRGTNLRLPAAVLRRKYLFDFGNLVWQGLDICCMLDKFGLGIGICNSWWRVR